MSALKPSGRTVDPGGLFAPAGPAHRRPVSFRLILVIAALAGALTGIALVLL